MSQAGPFFELEANEGDPARDREWRVRHCRICRGLLGEMTDAEYEANHGHCDECSCRECD